MSKIAVVRANALGDFIFVLPALQALRDTYPRAEIIYLGKAWHQEFISGRVDMVDRVVAVPPCPGVGEDEAAVADDVALDSFFEEMQRERFDVAVQLHGGGRYSNPFTARLGAGLTVGLQADDAPPLDRTVPYVYYQNEILRYLEVVSLISARTDKIVPRITVTRQDEEEVRATVKGVGPYVVMHPGASDVRRRWPAERFGTVAQYLLNEGYAVYVTGVMAEAEPVKRIVALTEGRAVALVDRLSLGGLAALCKGAALVVSNDTGPLHLAGAAGTPTVGIYWCGNLINAGPMTRAGHRPLLSWVIKCPECGKDHTGDYPFTEQACNHQVSFVAGVTTEQCIKACHELL